MEIQFCQIKKNNNEKQLKTKKSSLIMFWQIWENLLARVLLFDILDGGQTLGQSPIYVICHEKDFVE